MTPPSFESGRFRAKAAIYSVAAVALVDMATVALDFRRLVLLSRLTAVFQPEQLLQIAYHGPSIAFARLRLVFICIAGIRFLMWFHRAHRNLPALGASHLSYSPKWAVWGFFIPFVNLVRPAEVAVEIWKASDPEAGGEDWARLRAPRHILVWWGLFLLSGLSAWMLLSLTHQLEDIADLTDWLMVSALQNFIDVAAAVFAILMLRDIDSRQEKKSSLQKAGQS